MTHEEIDTLWQQAMQESIKDGEMFTRYNFAKLVSERALAQPEQEPVNFEKLAALGWQAMECNICGGGAMGYPQRTEPVIDKSAAIRIATALGWTPPRTWVGLTDKEIDQGLVRTNHAMQTAGAWRDGVEWATKQLREKNNE